MINDTLLRPLQAVINRRIEASVRARELLADLDDQVLAIDFTGTPLAIYFVCDEAMLRLTASYPRDPDAVLRGSPLSVARLATGDAADGIHVEGDAATAQRFQELIGAARPDWEEELSRLTGDVVAHQIGNALRGFGRWSQHAFRSFTADVGEFLQEESRELPARAEVEGFAEDVERLQRSLERAEKRLSALEARLD